MTSSRPRAGQDIKFVPKGWGFEKWIVNCEQYCGKLLYIAKGKKCSWHYHNKKDEVPIDGLGGWRENWQVYYVGKKI